MSKLKVTSKNSPGKSGLRKYEQGIRPVARPVALAAVLLSLMLAGSAISAEPTGLNLNAKLRGALIKEMVEVQAAMHVTYSAIVQGDHATVAQQGKAIHDSFILEQALTEQDLQDLVATVPAEFLQMDEQFHQLAAALAEAGRQENTQEQVEVFGQLTESCVACHSSYVTDRFSGLRDQAIPETWGHGEDHGDAGEAHSHGHN